MARPYSVIVRVTPLVFTLIRQPGMRDAQLAKDKAAVESELKTLKQTDLKRVISRAEREVLSLAQKEFGCCKVFSFYAVER